MKPENRRGILEKKLSEYTTNRKIIWFFCWQVLVSRARALGPVFYNCKSVVDLV